MANDTTEQRLERLESRAAHIEHTADQLDQALVAQQREIESLSSRVTALERLVARLDSSLLGDGPHHGA